MSQKNWFDRCPLEYRPLYYWWYVDGIFVLFKSCDQFKWLQGYLTSCHSNMSFAIKTEQNNNVSFLDANDICEQGTYTTKVYQKPILSGAYNHFDWFLPNTHKIGMVYTFKGECKKFSKILVT